MSYTLVNATAMNRQRPSSFFLPSSEEFAALSPGDFVKVGFETTRKAILERTHLNFEIIEGDLQKLTERMWVEVKSVEGDAITGELNNEPFIFFGILKLGDQITLKMENVMSIMLKKE